MKDPHFNEKEAKVYNEIVGLARYINEKREKGWLLLNPDGDIYTFEKIVFDTPFTPHGGQCVSFKRGNNLYSTIVNYKETNVHGEDTFLQEYKAALNYLKMYKLWEPKKVHNL